MSSHAVNPLKVRLAANDDRRDARLIAISLGKRICLLAQPRPLSGLVVPLLDLPKLDSPGTPEYDSTDLKS